MPFRPLALAALLLLTPAPGAAHATEAGPPPTPAADSSAGDPSSAPPAVDEPAEPLPETGPAETPAPVPGGGPAPDAGSTSPDARPSLAPGGHEAPEPGGVRAEELRAGDGEAADGRTGDGPAEAAPSTPLDPAELPALERASFVGPHTATAHRPGSGALVGHEPVLGAQGLTGRQQVTPGTLTRISLGTVTRVPAQATAGDSSTTGWVVGLSALGAAAAAAVALRSRALRAR
ncbi:UNVERIFIED_CONTAM: hypothetical protein RF653_02365 [Kocuria sp. CPCC 205316]|uniref:hypothetical protein n=1 Tax=Kocuria TaxID=57493 RepID=UPI0036D7C624